MAARLAVSPRALVGVLLLAVAVVAVLGIRVVLAGRDVYPGPVPPVVAGSPPGRITAPAEAAGGAAAGARSPLPPESPAVPSGVPPSAVGSGSGGQPAGAQSTATQLANTQSDARPSTVGPGATVGGTGSGSASGNASSSGDPSGVVVVHVVGRVRHPGVVRLPAGSRVEQAVTAAGGARRDADLTRVNLARPLLDGEQVLVPRPGEPVTGEASLPGLGVPAPPSGTRPGGGSATAGGTTAQAVDVNTATLAELDTLPGVGPVLAQRILDWRAQNGRFTAVDELGEVSGIGDAVLARIRPLVRL